MTAPTPAKAVATCTVGGAAVALPAPTAPIVLDETQPIVCVNGDTRIAGAGNAIHLYTDTNRGAYIYLNNSGNLASTGGLGIRAYTLGATVPPTSSIQAISTLTRRAAAPARVAARSTSMRVSW